MASVSLANRAYIVTGAGSGIGLATVHKLLARSATVHLLDRATSFPDSIDATAKQYGAEAKVYRYPSVDVSSRAAISQTFKSILSRSPQIDGLVNSAGVCPSSGGILENDETFHQTIAVNLNGTWNAGTELLRYMMASRSKANKGQRVGHTWEWKAGHSGACSIVNIGSSASYYGFQTLGAYVASKHAVLGLTRTWALDFAPFGVRVNLVAPGGVRTPLSQAQFDDAERGNMSREVFPLIPLKRFGEPEELADAIVFLLSDQSSYVTGQILKVNGGWP